MAQSECKWYAGGALMILSVLTLLNRQRLGITYNPIALNQSDRD